jgi:hypothetical protein
LIVKPMAAVIRKRVKGTSAMVSIAAWMVS